MISRKFSIVISVLILLILFVRINGKLLDMEAERVVHQLYSRDADGVINGAQAIAIDHNRHRALVLIHGFLSSPQSFTDVVRDLNNKINMDIYVPLLPFHGRDLETASRMDNQIILNYLKQYIADLSKKYQSVTVLGFSYGGALLTDLARTGDLPQNINIILEAPAIFIKPNTVGGRITPRLYGLWRNYCNYPAIGGCQIPVYADGDATAKPMFTKVKSLQYKIGSSTSELYRNDLNNRDWFRHINRPYSLIVAVDDARVSFQEQKDACEANKKYCHFYPFDSGSHYIHWGANKKAFENLLMELTSPG